MKRKAHYPVTHTQIKTFTASSGVQQVSIDNAFLGPIPERVLIAMVKNTAFVGSASTNPFHFSTLLSHSQWIALRPLELLELTKLYFRVLVYITMTVLT